MVTRDVPLESEPAAGLITDRESATELADYELQAAELVRTREQLELRRRLLEVVAKISSLIARSSEFSGTFFEALRMIGEAACFSRCLLLQKQIALTSSHAVEYKVVAEWCAPGVRSHHDVGTGTIAAGDAAEFVQKLRHGETFWCGINEVEDTLRKIFERMEIRATGCAPIMVDDELWGTLTFDDCVRDDPWDEAHVDALTAVANTISNALQTQYRAEKLAIERAEAAQERAAELAKSNAALRRSISRLANVPDVEAAMIEAIATAAEVVGSSGGALGLYLPEERGFRTIFQIVDGERVDLEDLSYERRIYSLDEEPIRLAWEQFHSGDGFLLCAPDSCYLTEDSQRLIQEQGFTGSILMALKRGVECIGYLGFFSRRSEDLLVSQRELLRAIGDQISLMLELARLARLSENAAVTREREAAALEQATELAKANVALRHTIDALSKQTDLISFVDQVLQVVAEQLQSPLVEYWETPSPTTARLVLSCREGVSYTGSDWPEDPRVRGVFIPTQLAHSTDLTRRESYYIVEDLPGRQIEQDTYGPLGLDLTQWCAERGVCKYINIPLRSGLITSGALVAYFSAERSISASSIELALALAQQITLAVTVTELSASAASAAATREREMATQKHAAELAKANSMLRSAANDLVKVSEPDEILALFLKSAIEAAGAASGAILRRTGETEFTFVTILHQDGTLLQGEELACHPLTAEVKEKSRLDPSGYFFRLAAGETVWRLSADKSAGLDAIEEWHERLSNRALWDIPFKIGNVVAGYVGLAFQHADGPNDIARETIQTLANQVGISFEMTRLAEVSKQTAILKERETAAQERSAELSRANDALRLGVEQIAGMSETREIAHTFLIQAVHAVSASGGAILLHVPGTVSAFRAEAVYEGHLLGADEIANHPYLGTLAELTANNPMGLFASILSGEFVMVRTSDLKVGFPAAYKYHSERGDKCIWQAPLQVKKRTIGYLGFAIASEDMPAPVSLETIRALCHQLVLALEMTRLAEEDKVSAVLRERETSARAHEAEAKQRAIELARINALLRKNSAALALAKTSQEMLEAYLLDAVDAMQGMAGGVLRRVGDTEHKFVALVQGATVVPRELWASIPLMQEDAEVTREDKAGVIARVMAGEDVWFTVDELASWAPMSADYHRNNGNHYIVLWPYRKGGEVAGYLGIAFGHEVSPTDSQRETMKALSTQAALALDLNAMTARAEQAAAAREREIAAQERAAELELANEALRKGIAGLGQLDDLSLFLEEMLKAALSTAGAHAGGVVLLNDAEQTYRVFPLLRSHGGFESQSSELTSSMPISPQVKALFEDINATNTAWLMTETDNRMDPVFVNYHKAEGNRLVAHIPMRVGDRLLGMLGLGFPNCEAQFEKDFSLLRSLADQMCLAVEMVRLSEEAKFAAAARAQEKAAREHAAELAMANEALRKGVDGLVRLENLDLFLREMLKAAVATAGAHGGVVALLDDKQEFYRFAALLQRDGSFASEALPLLQPIRVSPGVRDYLNSITVNAEAWSLPPEDTLHEPATRKFHEAEQNRALRHIPMVVNGRLIGWLGLGFADANPELGRSHSLLRVLADQMTMAVEMLRLSEEAKSAAIAREREQAAQQRAAEYERVNQLLRESAQALALARTPDEICQLFLLQAVNAMQGTGGGLLEVVEGTEHRFVALSQGDQIVPKVAWEQLPIVTRNREITAEDQNGVMARLLQGEDVWFPVDDVFARWAPESAKYHKQFGNAAIVLWPFYFGKVVKGSLGIAFAHTKPLNATQRETLKALSSQASLALELSAMTAEVEIAAVAREREAAAQARAVELARANEQLALRDRLLTASAKALEHLLSTTVFRQGVNEALRQIGEAAELSRVKVLLQDRSDASVPVHKLAYEWWAGGLQSQTSLGYVSFPDSTFQNELTRLHSEHRWWGRIEDWPESIQPAFRIIGVSSVGIVPIYVQQEYVGLVAFDQSDADRNWSEPEIDALTIAARGLGAALSQERIIGQLADEREKAAHERAAELSRTNKELALRDRLLTASANALEQLISSQDFSAGIQEALRQIGEAAQLSRVQVLLEMSLPNGELAHELVHEWWSDGLVSQKTIGYVIFPNADQTPVIDRLHRGERWWAKTEEWPIELQPTLRELGIVWTGVVPIFVQQRYVGFMAFDQCVPDRDWSEAEIDALTIAARGIGAALSQERMAAQLVSEREQAAQERASELVKANHALRSSVDDLVTQTTTDGILISLLKQAIDISGANSGAILRRVAGTEFEYVTVYADGVVRTSQEILAAGTNTEMRLASRLDPTGHFRKLARGEAQWREVDDESLVHHLPRSTNFHRMTGNKRIYDFPYKVAGQVFGYLGLAFAGHEPPSETVQETIKALATQVGLALEFRSISERVERAAVMEERNKFARDLHDTLAQGFAAIIMQLGAAEQVGPASAAMQPYLTRIDDLARLNLAEARKTVNELRTSERVRDALLARLSDLARQLESAYGSVVQVNVTGSQRALPPIVEDELYLIAQESLTNVMKHAQAVEIKLEVCFSGEGLRLKVKDNGVGFSSEERSKPDHYGLQTMQERSHRIGANLTIISEPGFGTEILTIWKDVSQR